MSDIKVDCPHCKQPLEVPEEMMGTVAECPSCNGQIQLPSRQSKMSTNVPQPQTRSPQLKQSVVQTPLQKAPIKPPLVQSRQQPKPAKTVFVVVAALVIVVICLVGAVVILLNRQGSAQNQIANKTDAPSANPNFSNVRQTPKPRKARVPGSVEGGAWVIKGGGQSDVLRGLTVYILPAAINTQAIAPQLEELREDCEKHEEEHAETAKKWEKDEECREKQKMMRTIGDAVKNMLASTQEVKSKEIYDFIRADNLSSMFPDLGVSQDEIWPKTVAATAIASGTTGIDGKYSVSNLAEGDYILYAQAAAATYIIEWCVPVTVKAGQITKIDLFNDNAALALKRE